MTTDTRVTHGSRAPSAGLRALVGAAATALLVGLGLAIVAGLAEDRTAAGSALLGTAIAVGVFFMGAFAVNVVAAQLPAASLLVAMLTYTLQVVLMGLLFWALSTSGALEESLSREWLAGTVIACTLAWLAAQVTITLRTRIPVYDLPPAAPTGGE